MALAVAWCIAPGVSHAAVVPFPTASGSGFFDYDGAALTVTPGSAVSMVMYSPFEIAVIPLQDPAIGATMTLSGVSQVASSYAFTDGTVTLKVGADTAAVTVQVDPCLVNVPPVITLLDGDPLVVAINTPTSLIGYFDDANLTDVHTATWTTGGAVVDVTNAVASPAMLSIAFAEVGINTVTLTVEDDCGGVTSQDIIVVAFDPMAGFTTGGGWFVPDGESFIDGTMVVDTKAKANFGFVVKYKKGADTPHGSLEFVYKKGDINLHSTDMQWLVIQSDKDVRFKGTATINGEGLYTFKVSARDNGEPGAGSDEFKIEIWLGVQDTENGPPTPKHMAKGTLGGGNIQIHQK